MRGKWELAAAFCRVFIVIGVLCAVLAVSWAAVGREAPQAAPGTADPPEKAEGAGEAQEEAEASAPPPIVMPVPAPEENQRLFVCVPKEDLPLRRTPSAQGEILRRLVPGTLVRWTGEVGKGSGAGYYLVEPAEGGPRGYVLERYCIPVETPVDESFLTIVDTGDAMYTYEEMEEDIALLAEAYPDRFASEVIGETPDGRKIYALTIGSPEAEHHVMMQAAIHAREYMTSELVMKMAEYYCCYYDAGRWDKVPYRALFERTAIHLVPMANPDGVSVSQSGVQGLRNTVWETLLRDCYERDHSKLASLAAEDGTVNWYDHYREPQFDVRQIAGADVITLEEYLSIWKANVRGVDLNRNFDAGWEEFLLKERPAYASFKGERPLSEPETIALADYSRRYDFSCFVNYHSRGNIIYYDAVGSEASVSAASRELALFLQEHIRYGTVDTTKEADVHPGGFGDWAQRVLGKPSVTLECGYAPCPLEIWEFPGMWARHRESWAKLLYRFLVSD